MEISLDVQGDYDRWNTFESSTKEPGFSHYIFNPEVVNVSVPLNHRVSARWHAENDILVVGDPRGKVGVSVEWGGKEKPKGRLYVEGSAGNKNGRIHGDAQIDNNGKGKAHVEVKPNDKEKDKKKD